jgi:hypothetical protein
MSSSIETWAILDCVNQKTETAVLLLVLRTTAGIGAWQSWGGNEKWPSSHLQSVALQGCHTWKKKVFLNVTLLYALSFIECRSAFQYSAIDIVVEDFQWMPRMPLIDNFRSYFNWQYISLCICNPSFAPGTDVSRPLQNEQRSISRKQKSFRTRV